MLNYALLIDYEYCSGCKSCEIACRNEHDFPDGCWGIRVREEEPWQMPDEVWNWDYIPVPTGMCDLCQDRLAKRLEPMCVQSCQAKVMEVAPIETLAARMAEKGKKVVIFKP